MPSSEAAPARSLRSSTLSRSEPMVAECDMVESGGGWAGVVYPFDGDVDCGTSSPMAERQAYRGPCKSGWVDEPLELMAG
ncbi:hypothetical protein FHS01_002960 [Longimicrobium terrae]|uniref:Uncharacterized protein n=1 Tax=Longimicrobium terrae TaxID=1639882 RepID=A0A841H0C2_9BACT|nr:hypothetical protein [Longimicrobium terrae]MBB6071453.1 hypothetical protein [Longimicrobium terrae]